MSPTPENPAAKDGRGGIQALHRAFDILEIVGASKVIGATRIAAELGLAVSTVNNLCRTMAKRGYLIGERGQYRLGPAISAIAGSWDPVTALPSLVGPVLERISDRTGQASVAMVLVGPVAHVIDFSHSRGPVGTPRPHSDRPPLDLPTGTVLVALGRRAQWNDFIQDAVQHSPLRLGSAEWLEELEHVAATAICARRSTDPAGQAAIAVPVWNGPDSVLCALGVSTPTFLADDELGSLMATSLIEAAAQLSRDLGYAGSPAIDPGLLRWREVPTA